MSRARPIASCPASPKPSSARAGEARARSAPRAAAATFRIRPRIEYALLAVARSLPVAVVVAVALVTSSARGDGPRFGDRGTFAFGGDLGLGGQQGLNQGYDTIVTLELDPAFDIFAVRRLSLGVGSVLSTTIDRTSPGSSFVAVSPRVGYAVPFGGRLVLWPRVSADFAFDW